MNEISKIERIIDDPEIGLVPFLDLSLGENWNRFYIKPWFPKGLGEKECGFRLREASSTVEGDRIKINQIIMLGRVFFIDDATEGAIKASQLQQDLDHGIVHWSKFVCPLLIGPVTGFEGGPLGPTQNKTISSERPMAWECFVIRYFTISYYGESSIDFCCFC